MKVEAGIRLELADQPIHNPLVEIIAAKVRIAIGRLHLDYTLTNLKNRDVEGTAAEVIDRNRLVLLLIEPRKQAQPPSARSQCALRRVQRSCRHPSSPAAARH